MIAQTFPREVLDRLKDCILAVQYKKNDIIQLLKDCGCTDPDLGDVRQHQERNYRRADIVDLVFERLTKRADGGLGQLRAMTIALEKWDSFDGYWFQNGKLDASQARNKIQNLQLVLERDRRKRDEFQVRQRQQQLAEQKRRRKEDIYAEYLSLHKNEGGTPQERGIKFERLLRELAQTEGLEVTDAFRVVGEQIDGSIKYEGEHYIIEAKWHDKLLCNEAVYAMAAKVHGKMYGRGLFISVHGYTDQVVQQLTHGKVINMILFDGADLTKIFEGYATFKEVLDQKVKAAQTKGRIYVHHETLEEKISG